MEITKPALASIGIWGGIGAFGSGIIDIINQVASSGALPDSWHPYVVAVSGILALLGRFKAKTKIKGIL